jgi:hypothetical protein
MTRGAWAPLIAVLLLGPLLLSWPLPLVFGTELLSHPEREAVSHVWGLWAAARELSPLVLDSSLLNHPDGLRVVVIDPVHVPVYALAGWISPAAGFNTVLLFGGVAGAVAAREVEGRPWLGALAAMACPAMLAATAEGTTEDLGAGWVLLQLALLLRFTRTARARDGLLAGLALAAAVHAGPYNGAWAALIDASVGAWWLWRDRTRALRALLVGAGALLVSLPWAWAVLVLRPDHLPGGGQHLHSQGPLPEIREAAEAFRGGLWHGADLLDPWLPGPLTGGEGEVSHTAYVGLVALLVAGIMVARDRSRWPWLVGSLVFSVVSLGPWLYLAGEALRLGDSGLLAPVGVAMKALPGLSRLTRWYRAGAVAALLLAPLVSRVPGRWALLVAPLVLLDTLALAPLKWPLHHQGLPRVQALMELEGEGALLEIPPFLNGAPPPGAWRDHNMLAQVEHGHPLAGSMLGLHPSGDASRSIFRARALSMGQPFTERDLEKIRAGGYRWLALHRTLRPAGDEDDISACLGEPIRDSPEVVVWSLEGSVLCSE